MIWGIRFVNMLFLNLSLWEIEVGMLLDIGDRGYYKYIS